MREIEVWRGALSKDTISKEGAYVWVGAGGAYDGDTRRGIKIDFSIASKGGGKTSLKVWIGSAEFPEVLDNMRQADPAAFEAALARLGGRR